jgi:signal peptidase II
MRKNIFTLILELLLIISLIALDLITKKYIYGPIASGQPDIILISGVLRFTAIKNTGASFGIFADYTNILTIVSIITVIGALVVLILTQKKINNPLFKIAMSLIIAGGIGNIIDRLKFGYVRDFIYFELIDFAVFNIADSCLTIGCIILIMYILWDFFATTKKNK